MLRPYKHVQIREGENRAERVLQLSNYLDVVIPIRDKL